LIYRQAEVRDAPDLAAFAERVFVTSFENQLPRAELALVARERFSLEQQQMDIADPASTIFLALDPAIAGYAHLAVGNRPQLDLIADAPAELKRIYVDATWHGRGVAQMLLKLVESRARENGCDVLWLKVWDGNMRGIAFYEKQGFELIGSSVIAVGAWSLGHHYMSMTLRALS
jgi:ribosomal protein S18 acetylase RimI-like enzyme